MKYLSFLTVLFALVFFGAACQRPVTNTSNGVANTNGNAIVNDNLHLTNNPTQPANTNAAVVINTNNQNTNRTNVPATGLLLRIDYTGGLCQVGACRKTETISADGSYVIDGQAQPKLSAVKVRDLRAKMASADWTSIKAKPFTGNCPRDFDGSAVIFTFTLSDGTVVLDSCQIAINYEIEPFKTILQIQSGS